MQADMDTIRKFNAGKVIVIDTETTGLDPEKDEVLSVSVVDVIGRTLFDHLIKPQRRQRWPKATEIHGIRWADVKNEQTLLDYERELAGFFDGSYLIVGYNVEFDIEMLKASGAVIANCYTFDVMREASSVYGEWSEWKQDRKWMKLSECASGYGYPAFNAHSSLADAQATAYCFRCLLKDPKYAEHLATEKARQEQQAKLEIEKALRDAEQQRQSKIFSRIVLLCTVLVIVFVIAFSLHTCNALLFG